jgi:hypothetical protein
MNGTPNPKLPVQIVYKECLDPEMGFYKQAIVAREKNTNAFSIRMRIFKLISKFISNKKMKNSY